MPRPRNGCGLLCGATATASVCGYRLCTGCIARLRAIAIDAGVAIDEGMLGGGLRRLRRRAFTRAERAAEDKLERRAIAAARRSA